MRRRRLLDLFGDVSVAVDGRPRGGDTLEAAWSRAEAEAARALEAWRASRSSEDYAVYVASAARADAAQDALAHRAACARSDIAAVPLVSSRS